MFVKSDAANVSKNNPKIRAMLFAYMDKYLSGQGRGIEHGFFFHKHPIRSRHN